MTVPRRWAPINLGVGAAQSQDPSTEGVGAGQSQRLAEL
jgi:hypothetical protein